MPNSLDLHFEVFQVLEEEYISLYGHLEQETKTYLRDRTVTSALDWNFHQGHIRNWENFKRHVQEPNPNLPRNVKRAFAEEGVSDWRDEAQAVVSVNRILAKPIFDRLGYRHIKLRETTEKLFDLCSEENGSQISTDELKRLNRFLLEDLFPEHLEKVSEIRLAAIYQRRHDKESAALCFSGGGIRSGTFALGLLQGLARHNLLTQFDYLSTVSGGGYIGAWLTGWIHRHRGSEQGLAGVTTSLKNVQPESKIDPEPAALRYLRENSNFLTPEVGLMSADTWTFLAIYVRNLLLNWSVLIPLLLGVLLIPRFSVAAVLAQPSQAYIRRLVLWLGFISASWAIAYIAFSRPGLRTRLIEANPRWKERMGQRGFLKYCLAPLALAAITLTSYWAWTPSQKKWWQFLLFGLATSLLGLLWSSFVLRSWLRKRVKTVMTRTWRDNAFIAVLLLLIAGGVGGLIARAAAVLVERAKLLDENTGWTTELYVCYAVPFFMLLFMLALIVFAGISSHFLGKITEEDREWWARFSAWSFITAIAWAVFSTLVIFGPLALLEFPRVLGAVGGLSGLLALLLGRSGKTPATSEQVAQGGLKAQLSSLLLPLLAVLFIAVFIAGLSLLTSKLIKPVSVAVDEAIKATAVVNRPGQISTRRDLDASTQTPPSSAESTIPVHIGSTKIGEFSPEATEEDQILDRYADDHMKAVHYPRWWLIAGLMIVLLGFGLLMARVINLNLFSLHNSYRSRLIRGFLAASRDKLLRQPNPFTGFDPADNVSMHELRPALLHEVDFIDFDCFVNQFNDAAETAEAAESVKAETTEPETASQFIYGRLSKKVQDEIDDRERDTPVPQALRADLIEDLNRILEDEEVNLCQHPGFARPSPTSSNAPQLPEDVTPSAEELRLEYHIHRNRRAMELTYPQFIVPSDYPPHKLFHVVNTTLNLVGGDNLAWQQRKAEPFTISPLHCGSYRVGYRRSKDYGGDDGISLGTAMAISGAAASSNMGYYTTSPVLSLVLTLFNVRLGWWLGNPGPAGSHSYGLKPDEPSKKIYRRMSPTLSVLPVLYEAFGLTDDRSDYIYLTDGGHFENLALYEMVLRRCKLIVVSDGAADAKYQFNDLANAVRKIRIDLGVPIEFPAVPIYREAPIKDGEKGCYWAVGMIRYSQIDRQSDGTNATDGMLIYIKPAVYGDEPEDVVHYKRTHPTFPNETTADQFFDEPQFESYRALGSYIMDRMCGSHSGDLSKPKFVSQVMSNLFRMAPQTKKRYLDFWGDADKARDPHSPVLKTKDG